MKRTLTILFSVAMVGLIVGFLHFYPFLSDYSYLENIIGELDKRFHDGKKRVEGKMTKDLGNGFALYESGSDRTMLAYDEHGLTSWDYTPPQEVPLEAFKANSDQQCGVLMKKGSELLSLKTFDDKMQDWELYEKIWENLSLDEKKECTRQSFRIYVTQYDGCYEMGCDPSFEKQEKYKNDYRINYRHYNLRGQFFYNTVTNEFLDYPPNSLRTHDTLF